MRIVLIGIPEANSITLNLPGSHPAATLTLSAVLEEQ